jgi:hypothetical protein
MNYAWPGPKFCLVYMGVKVEPIMVKLGVIASLNLGQTRWTNGENYTNMQSDTTGNRTIYDR